MEVEIKEDNNVKEFGKFIRSERKKKKLTQQELADLCGLSTMSIRRYESGERQPGYDEMIKIAKVLGFMITVDAQIESSIDKPIKLQDIDQIQKMFTSHTAIKKICIIYNSLNENGRKKILEMAEMISLIPEYQMAGDESNGND